MRPASTTPPAKSWQFLLAGLVYAVLCVFAFPPVSLWPIALVAPAPLIWVGCRCRGRPIRAAMLASVGSLPFWVFTHLYLINVTELGFPLMCVYLSAYCGIFVVLLNAILRAAPSLPAALAAPLAWTVVELLRGEVVLTGYSWYLAGQPLIDVPILAAPAAILSVYFVSTLVVALCGAAADSSGWSGRKRSSGGLSAAVVISAWTFCSLVATLMPRPPSKPLRVAVVQTNIPQDNKTGWSGTERFDSFRRTSELTRQAALSVPKPEVIIWPETMFPGAALNPDALGVESKSKIAWKLTTPRQIGDGRSTTLLARRWFSDELLKMQSELEIPIVVGAIAMENLEIDESLTKLDSYSARFNSVFVVNNGQVDPNRYDKIDLTPFGEVIPYVWRWPELQREVLALGANGMAFDLSFGSRPRTISLPLKGSEQSQVLVRVSSPVCFEATRPRICRELAVHASDGPAAVMFNLSNDGWFADFTGREMHLQAARWRCVELDLPMVRAVNTGLSAAIDRNGRMIAFGPVRPVGEHAAKKDGVMTAEVPMVPAGPSTIFARAGFVPLLSVLAGMGLTVPVFRVTARRAAARGSRL